MKISMSNGDAWQRRCDYLRISVTDRCNLKCAYCVSCERQKYIPHERILRYEEFGRLAAIAKSLGIRKIRITGGEPFCRLGLMPFLTGLRRAHPDLELALTTNATLIGPHAKGLARLGLSSINISLDTFDRDTFRGITGSDLLGTVLCNIDRLLVLGQRVKLNAVILAGITDAQIGDFIHAIKAMPLDLRFIEYMPMGGNTMWVARDFLSCASLRDLISRHVQLEKAAPAALAGPARMYTVPGARGRVGFISAVSDHFCKTCNRLRITSDGHLRLCLFSDRELRLAPLLRNRKIRDCHIRKVLGRALRRKPLGSDILAARTRTAVAQVQMVGIGG